MSRVLLFVLKWRAAVLEDVIADAERELLAQRERLARLHRRLRRLRSAIATREDPQVLLREALRSRATR